jgi:hypothetical protein
MAKGVVLIRSIVDLKRDLDTVVNSKHRIRITFTTCAFKQRSICVLSLVKPPSINKFPVLGCVVSNNFFHIRRLTIVPVVLVRVTVCVVHVGTPPIERRGASGRLVIIMGRFQRKLTTPVVVVKLELQQCWACQQVLDTRRLIIQRKAFLERGSLTLPCHVCDNLQAFGVDGVQKLLEQISSIWAWSSVCISQCPQRRIIRKINVSAVSWT